MDCLGPWDTARRVAIAVSGGPDSLALALLAQAWGDPAAFIVDHGLRRNAAAEAETARAALAGRGIPAQVLKLEGLALGPALAARAREARYTALTAACREAGLVDLLLGHHAGDQAETVLMRRRRASRPDGLAGMAALVERDNIRLLRPLLSMMPEQLRAVVDAAGLVPAEDPGNTDERSTRARLRREIGSDHAALLAAAAAAGAARTQAEAATAAELAVCASLYPEGYATLLPGPLGTVALAALLRSLSGRRYPVDASALAGPKTGTLAGVRLQAINRAGGGWLLTRETAAMAPPVAASAGAVWDGRFRMASGVPGAQVGALGLDAAQHRTSSELPGDVLRTLPAFRYDGLLSAVPHLGYVPSDVIADGIAIRNACLPAACAPFLASRG